MTSPPRLAPLETMTESDYQWCRDLQRAEHAAFSLVLQYLEKATAEIEAQRLARARARREAFRAGFLAVIDKTKASGWSFDGPAAADREQEAWEAWLVALRDREDA